MHKILIVDDSATMRKIIMRALRQAEMKVDKFLEAGNGVEALKILANDPDVELVLTDINMPQMDGISFVKAVRQKHTSEDLPMIMITTEAGTNMLLNAIACGADGYVTKPFTPESIREGLGKYFEKAA